MIPAWETKKKGFCQFGKLCAGWKFVSVILRVRGKHEAGHTEEGALVKEGKV